MFFFQLSPILLLLFFVTFESDCLSVVRPHVNCHEIPFNVELEDVLQELDHASNGVADAKMQSSNSYSLMD